MKRESYHLGEGVLLQERYCIKRVVSYGGFGIVYEAWDTVLECRVAVKEFFPSGLVTREADVSEVRPVNGRRGAIFEKGKNRFLLEAQIMTRFDGKPNIVSIMNFFEQNQTAYIVMEFLEGITLKEYLRQEHTPIGVAQALEITIAVCDTMKELHKQKILHRDIAPDNIFLCEGGQIKLIDFGAARIVEQDNTLTKVLKIGFAPPEQYSSDKQQGIYTDVYALGATLYYMLTGRMPEEATNRQIEDMLAPPDTYNPQISRQLSNAILRAMALHPGLRYQTMEEFKRALLEKDNVQAPQEELKTRKRRRLAGSLLLLLFICVGAFAGFYYWQKERENAQLPEAEITIWFPVSEGESAENSLAVILKEFQENYPHVTLTVMGIQEEGYAEAIDHAFQSRNLPDVFYQTEYHKGYAGVDLWDAAEAVAMLDKNQYYFNGEMKQMAERRHQLPTGFVATVLYTTEGARELSENEITTLLEEQLEKGMEQSLADYLSGASAYFIGGTDYYYDIFRNMETSAVAGRVEVRTPFKDAAYGHLSDVWCVSGSIGSDKKLCIAVLFSYILGGNSQRSFFTVETERQSAGCPLYKEVFETNYYNNMVKNKMSFLEEDLEKMVLLDDFEGEEGYYRKLLSVLSE